ncbi:MAG: M13 family metallopeptidase N-terminal domain-containing protein, partial [Novosphingobium sp.]
MTRRPSLAAVLLAASVLAGPVACSNSDDPPSAAVTPGTEVGVDRAAMDKTVKPGDDFYGYANGNWMKATEIPPDRSSVGGFYIADQATEKKLEAMVAEIVASDPEPGSDAARIKAFYQAFVDTAAIDRAGLAPVRPELDRIAAIADKAQLAAAIGASLRADVDPLNHTDFETENLFGVFVTQALAGGEVVPYILQGGLGMPEREYFLSPDPKMAAHRAAYQTYIGDVLTAAAVPDAAAKAQRI